MRIDKAGDSRVAAQVDHFNAGGNWRGGSNAFDSIALDQDHSVVYDFAGSVDKFSKPDCLYGRGGLGTRQWEEGNQKEHQPKADSRHAHSSFLSVKNNRLLVVAVQEGRTISICHLSFVIGHWSFVVWD
jgi:hypothetical protein